jgi:hypothetical protein
MPVFIRTPITGDIGRRSNISCRSHSITTANMHAIRVLGSFHMSDSLMVVVWNNT